jgi:hypothetical protein
MTLVVLFGLSWSVKCYQTKSMIARINRDERCGIQRANSGNAYIVDLSDDEYYNAKVLEEMSNNFLSPFTELTVNGLTSGSIPTTSLTNVSEVHVCDTKFAGNDVAKLSKAFPNCHIWKFDDLAWEPSVQREVEKLPVPSVVFISSSSPEGIPSTVAFSNQTSVFWNP